MIGDPDVNTFELNDLDSKSYYVFKVVAYTAAGKGPPITRRGATLLEGGELSILSHPQRPRAFKRHHPHNLIILLQLKDD